MIERLKAWAGRIKRDVLALWLAARDRRTPWALSRAGAVLVVGLWLAAVAAAIILLVPDPLTLIR